MLDKARQPDIESAIKFLKALRPAGPWNLTAIVADGPISSGTFTDAQKARVWIAKHAGSANMHYSANASGLPSGGGGRVRKNDIEVIEFLHGDFDVDKLPVRHELASLSISERKTKVIRYLQELDEPTFIVDSGGGLQALWRLKEPLPATAKNIEWAEGANRGLAVAFPGGEQQCANIDHLLRLPGTVNYPNQQKLKRGRTVVPSRLVAQSGSTHDGYVFKTIATPVSEHVDTKFGAPEEVTELDALADQYGLPPKLIDIIVQGADADDPDRFPSRSEAVYYVVHQLLRRDVPPEMIMGVLLNGEWAISASVLEQDDKPGGRTAEQYAARQVRNAMEKQAGEQRDVVRMLDDTPVDPQYLKRDEDAAPGEQQETPRDWEDWFRKNWSPMGQCDIASIPPTPWVVEGILLENDVSTIGGRGGSGKSLFAWSLAIMVATGKSFAWWQPPAKPRRVLVISGEDDVNEVERRVSVACKAMNIPRSALRDNFMVWNHRTIRLAVKDIKSGKISRTELWQGVRWAIENLDVGVVMLDPVIKGSIGFDQSSNDDMDQFYAILRELTLGYPCAMLTVDHFAKGGTGGDQASIRGASAKVDASRVAATLTTMTADEHTKLRPPRPRESYVLFMDPKQNYARKTGGHWMELVEYDVGNEEKRPALIWRDLSASQEGFLDPLHWEHRQAFLNLVDDGREGGRPWSVTTSGKRDARLDVAAAERFDITERQATQWISAFAVEGSIVAKDWTGPNRSTSTVWAINDGYQTDEDAETEELRD
jgi:hypothetical protein